MRLHIRTKKGGLRILNLNNFFIYPKRILKKSKFQMNEAYVQRGSFKENGKKTDT